jgi:hypothetical protein
MTQLRQAAEPVPNVMALWNRTRLIMLGTIHRDSEGAGLLRRVIEALAPEIVTLEFSAYGLLFRRLHGERLREQVDALVQEMMRNGERVSPRALDLLYDYIDLPCEYTIASQYADRVGIPLHLLDAGAFSYLRLQEMDALVRPDNIRTWFSAQDAGDDALHKEMVRARLFFEKGVKTFSYSDEMLVRDRHVTHRLMLLARQHRTKRVLHVCGWQHLSDPYSVYEPLNPVKVFLHDRSLCV